MANIDWSAHHESGEVATVDGGDWTTVHTEDTTTICGSTESAAFGDYGLKFYVDSDKYNASWVRYSGLPGYSENDTIHCAFYFKLGSNWTWSDGDSTYFARIGHDVGSPYDGSLAVWLTHSTKKMYMYFYPGERGIQCDTEIELDTWYHFECALPLHTGGTAIMSGWLDGSLDGETTVDNSYVDGNTWGEIILFRRFERTLTGASEIHFDAVRVGNDGMIGAYTTAYEWDWDNTGPPVYTASSSELRIDANADGGYAFLDSLNESERSSITAFTTDDSTAKYAVEVTNDDGNALRGYIYTGQSESFGPELLLNAAMTGWTEEGPDPAGDLIDWDESEINNSTRLLSKDTVIYNTAGTGVESAKMVTVNNTGLTSTYIRCHPPAWEHTANAWYQGSVYKKISYLSGHTTSRITVTFGAAWPYIENNFTYTGNTGFTKCSYEGAARPGESRLRTYLNVNTTSAATVHWDDPSTKRLLTSNGVAICSAVTGSEDLTGNWEYIEDGWETHETPLVVRVYLMPLSYAIPPPAYFFVSNQSYSTDQSFATSAETCLVLLNNTFDNCRCTITGAGDVRIESLQMNTMMTDALNINVSGSVDIFGMSIDGTGSKGSHQTIGATGNALTINGAETGTISDIYVKEFRGAGIYCAPSGSSTISGLSFSDIRVWDSGGAMHLINVSGCSVNDVISYESNFPSSTEHASGMTGHPSIIDEVDTASPRPAGTTTITNVNESVNAFIRTGFDSPDPWPP